MTAGSLRGDLLAIPGIEGAEIEGDSLSPAGVKVRLAPGADAAMVSEQVRRVLAAHGLSSELDPGESEADRPTPERILAPAPEPLDEGGEWDSAPEEEEFDRQEPIELEETAEMEAEPAPRTPSLIFETDDQPSPGSGGALASIAVEEDRNGVSVVATADDGRRAGRPARPDGRGLDEAVIAAVAALFSLAPPVVVALDEREVDGSTVLTVVLDAGDERRVAGSTLVEGGRPYAVGRAAWAALSTR